MELVALERLDGEIGGIDWHRAGAELVKVVRRNDFAAALAYVNEVGQLAEAAGHHPDIELSWNTVTLRLSTHSLGGITDADLALARRIDGLS
ncbi:MAG: transcriptional coactivator/pterin dehydratase [Acidimicrobiaceae bacterium]|nr:transcriptional coactivator/pterin dehydratase [Acidimicrobiaceae bacterium]